MKKFIEIFLFILINIILSTTVFWFYLICNLMDFLNPFPESFKVLDDFGLYSAIIIAVCSIITIWFIKLKFLGFLYSKKQIFRYLYELLKNFLKDDQFRNKVFVSILVLDSVIFILSSFKSGYIFMLPLTFVLGGGVLISYAAFYMSNNNINRM